MGEESRGLRARSRLQADTVVEFVDLLGQMAV
jgi:hypothetical protein